MPYANMLQFGSKTCVALKSHLLCSENVYSGVQRPLVHFKEAQHCEVFYQPRCPYSFRSLKTQDKCSVVFKTAYV